MSKLNNAELATVFAMYPGASVLHKGGAIIDGCYVGKDSGDKSFYSLSFPHGGISLEKCKLILTHYGDIEEEDAITIAHMLLNNDEYSNHDVKRYAHGIQVRCWNSNVDSLAVRVSIDHTAIQKYPYHVVQFMASKRINLPVWLGCGHRHNFRTVIDLGVGINAKDYKTKSLKELFADA